MNSIKYTGVRCSVLESLSVLHFLMFENLWFNFGLSDVLLDSYLKGLVSHSFGT